MDTNYPITDRIELITAHVRLIADLMLAGNDLKNVDRAAVARMMQHLADQLEAVTREAASAVLKMDTDKEAGHDGT